MLALCFWHFIIDQTKYMTAAEYQLAQHLATCYVMLVVYLICLLLCMDLLKLEQRSVTKFLTKQGNMWWDVCHVRRTYAFILPNRGSQQTVQIGQKFGGGTRKRRGLQMTTVHNRRLVTCYVMVVVYLTCQPSRNMLPNTGQAGTLPQ